MAVVDVDEAAALALAREYDALAFTDWRKMLREVAVDVVVVATVNDALFPVTVGALDASCHVLCEKPFGRTLNEAIQMSAAASRAHRVLKVGFNHRFHPAIAEAHRIVTSDELGTVRTIRGVYGHGGRPGYEKEWRADPALSGGGELIDQGVHLIDLARWFLGDFVDVTGFAHTYYWDMPVDDNGFMILKTADRKAAFLHVSCTEWKNLFSLEIYGRDAKLHIEGLGGSYGHEGLAFYRVLPEVGRAETTIWEDPCGDRSWELEFAEFLEDIRLDRTPSVGLGDARAALAVVEEVHRQSGYDFSQPTSGTPR